MGPKSLYRPPTASPSRVALLAMAMVLVMTASVTSDITFDEPEDGAILTQKAVTVRGTASAAPSHYLEDSYEHFDEGTMNNLTLAEDGHMSLDPYIDTWVKGNSNPVIDVGGSGSFNEWKTGASSVMLDGNTYKIWGEAQDSGSRWRFGLWTSANGNTWTASGSVFTTSGTSTAFDRSQIASPWVIKDGATYKMWYSGKATDGRWRIGYATSADGSSWTRGNSGNPVLDQGATAKFDGGGVAHPTVLKEGATYKMWYSGVIEGSNVWQVGHATSNNGIDWTRQNNSNPVVGFGKKGSYDEDGCIYPKVVKDGNNYRMWYIGVSKPGIDYASSKDGILWKKDPSNPLVNTGASGDFDDASIGDLAVMKDTTKFKMWYTGVSMGVWTVGYADADIAGLSGSYTSKPFNAGSTVTWGVATWNWHTPQGTSGKMETRTSADQITWGTWAEVANNSASSSAPNKYFQWRATLDTTDSNIIPYFYNFTIEYRQVIKVEVSTDNSSWYIANGTGDWDIGVVLVEGNNTIYVKVTDTTPYPQYANLKVRVDTTVPSGHIEVNGGDTFTTTQAVVLDICAHDIMGVESMRLGNSADLSGESWVDYDTTVVWTLPTGDGVKTVYIEFQDSNGLVSRTYSDTIILDTVTPEASVVINCNATFTGVTEVQLTLKAMDKNGISRMRVSTNEDFEGADWTPFMTTYPAQISEGDGIKTVYAEFEDMAGLVSSTSDTITLDTVKPTGSVEINGGDAITRDRVVNLTMWGDDVNGIKDMMVSNYPDFVDGMWTSYSTSKEWTLPNTVGEISVYARFRDNAGLTSECYSDSIFLHTSQLAGTVVINDGDDIAGDPLVDLEIALLSEEEEVQMMVSNSASFSGASYKPFAESMEWNMSATSDGVYSVYVKLKDIYGFESGVFSDSIEFDLSPPNITIVSPTQGERFKNGTIEVVGAASDNIGLARVEVSIDGGPWVQMQDMEEWTYRTTVFQTGTHTIRARAVDTVGHMSEVQISVEWKKKKKNETQPGFEGVVLLAAIGLLLLLRQRRRP